MTISGRAKSRKTWLAFELGLAVAGGLDFLGKVTHQGAVLYVNLEMKKESVRYRAQSISRALGLKLEEVPFCSVTFNKRALLASVAKEPDGGLVAFALVQELRKAIDEAESELDRQIDVVIVDSFYNVAGGADENKASDVADIYSLLRGLSDDLELSIVVIHHFAKGDPGLRYSGDRAAGSRIHRQAVDAYVEMVPHKEDDAYVIEVELRDYPGVAPFSVQWSDFRFELAPELDPRDLKKGSGRKEKYAAEDVLGCLDLGGMSSSQWHENAASEIGISRASFDRKRKELLVAKKVRKDGTRYFPYVSKEKEQKSSE